MRIILAILAVLVLGACTPAAVFQGAVTLYEACQRHGLAVAEGLDPLTRLDGPAYVARFCVQEE